MFTRPFSPTHTHKKAVWLHETNITAYHPQCDGMSGNQTLKAMLRKHAGRYGNQWDQHLARILWAYRNTPHETTGKKPSFLLFGMDCRSPTEAELSPPLKHKVKLMSLLTVRN